MNNIYYILNMEEQQTSTRITDNSFKGKSAKEMLELQTKLGNKKFSKIVKRSFKINNEDKDYRINKSKQTKYNLNIEHEGKAKVDKSEPTVRRMIRGIQQINNLKKIPKNINKCLSSSRDPRFHDLSGKLNMESWRKNYSFLSTQRKAEKDILIKEYSKCKNKKVKIEMQKNINRIENQERERGKHDKLKVMKIEEKQKAIESLKEGKNPYFTSDSQKMKTINDDYFKSLKNKDKYYIRKEKKLVKKERKSYNVINF